MRAQILKWGNSLAVRIPKSIAEHARLEKGDPIEIEVSEEGVVGLFHLKKMPTLTQLVSQITPENRYAELPVGAEVGKEVIEW